MEHYIKLGLDHLLDQSSYELLTEDQADHDIHDLRSAMHAWTIHHHSSLPEDTVNFIREHMDKASKDPPGYFFLLIKLPKLSITRRPISFDCASLPHALRRYVDATLQPIVKDQALYFKNLAKLKSDLEELDLPPNASLFTYDAVAMYPRINTADCLTQLSGYLSNKEVSSMYGFSSTALLEALELVMLNNCMRFGDIIVKQIIGIAMGMFPAPTIANLYVAIFETVHILQYIPVVVLYLHCFINDGFGVWLHDPDPAVDERNWTKFQDCLNASGLRWIFSERSQEAVFMDLWLKIP
jgi:hypothetical protein